MGFLLIIFGIATVLFSLVFTSYLYTLPPDQDTQYLFQIKDKLISMLEREDRLNLYNKCVKMIPTLVDMEIKGFKISKLEPKNIPTIDIR